MRTIDEVLDLLKERLKISTDAELATSLDIARNTVAGWKARKVIPYDLLISYCDKNNISIDWLLLDKATDESFIPIRRYDDSKTINSKFEIPFIGENSLYKIQSAIFQSIKVNPMMVFELFVRDDKMSPTFNRFDSLFIEKINSIKFREESGYYVLLINGLLDVRYIDFPIINDRRKIMVKPDNTKYTNMSFEVDKLQVIDLNKYVSNEIYIVGRVLMQLKEII